MHTSDAPPAARLPRCTRCQSFANPSSEEYWHIGETAIRLRKVTSRMASGLSKWTAEDELIVFSMPGALYRKLTPAYSFQARRRAHARIHGKTSFEDAVGNGRGRVCLRRVRGA